MKSKYIYILIIAYAICISAGIFMEISTPTSDISLFSKSIESFFDASNLSKEKFSLLVLKYIKDDFLYIVAILFLSLGVITLPISIILSLTKVFSMGFGAAFIVSSFSDNIPKFLLAGIVPRCFFRIPLYFYITLISVNISRIIFKNHDKKILIKELPKYILKLITAFILMVISSLIEVCLLVAVL